MISKIDKRKRVTDVVWEIRKLLEGNKLAKPQLTKFPVYGTPNINTLHNRYNALIQKITTNHSDKEIFTKDKIFRGTKYNMKEYKVDGGSWGRMMREIILPAKITLLSVCDGYFVTNPNKEYI